MAITKKRNVRPKTGLAGAPMNKGFDALYYYFQYELDKKVISTIIKKYAKKHYNKDQYEAIIVNPEWRFGSQSALAAALLWVDNGNSFPDQYSHYPQFIKEYFDELILLGHDVLISKIYSDDVKIAISPIDRFRSKVFDTVLADIDQLEDGWFDGEKTDINIYAKFQVHGLKARAIPMIKPRVESWLKEYQDAYDRTCEDAYNGYKHLGKRELGRRIKVLNTMLEDFDKIKSIFKPKRKEAA